MSGRPWTDEEKAQLRVWWGIRSINLICNRLGRSETAVRCMVRKLGLGHQTKGFYSLSDVVKATGYTRDPIMAEAQRLGLQLRQLSPRVKGRRNDNRRYSITKEQYEALIEGFKSREHVKYIESVSETWQAEGRPHACLECGTTEVRHFSAGYCYRCHWKRKRARLEAIELEYETMRACAQDDMLRLNVIGG